jgi:protein-disulfide isomerase-like protein with CxxC motif
MTEDEAWEDLEARLKREAAARVAQRQDNVLAEREACARLCEELGAAGYGTLAIAAAIRLRGKEK